MAGLRSIRHWTPHYIFSRLAEKRDQRAHPDHPWLTAEAVRFLEGYLRPSDTGLEFGSGRSTLWFARHLGHLTSVEHDQAWSERVRQMLAAAGVRNVDYLHIPLEAHSDPSAAPDYVRVVERFAPVSLDFALVDGRLRDECANAVLPKMRPGGLLVVDNADIYLPSQVRTPNARRPQQGPENVGWGQFLEAVSDWRRVWTCNGVFATALFFVPC